MNPIAIQYFKTPYGELVLGSFNEQLCLCDWRYRKMRARIDERLQQGLKTGMLEAASEVVNRTIQQLNDYFNRQRNTFEIPLLVVGSDFQRNVWDELLKIPFGQSASYGELALRLGNRKAVRAVASANGANAISIIIPCHRIIGRDGSLVGYAGGLKAKERLLQLEQNSSVQTQQLLDLA